jgi:hypothetical protein
VWSQNSLVTSVNHIADQRLSVDPRIPDRNDHPGARFQLILPLHPGVP